MSERAEKLREAMEQDAIAYCLPPTDYGHHGLTYTGGLPLAVARTICDTLGITEQTAMDLACLAPGVGAGCTCEECAECRDSLNRAADALDALLEVAGR